MVYFVLGIILYIILGVLYTFIQMDWLNCYRPLPNKPIKILLLILAIICLWPWFIIGTAVTIMTNES